MYKLFEVIGILALCAICVVAIAVLGPMFENQDNNYKDVGYVEENKDIPMLMPDSENPERAYQDSQTNKNNGESNWWNSLAYANRKMADAKACDIENNCSPPEGYIKEGSVEYEKLTPVIGISMLFGGGVIIMIFLIIVAKRRP